MSVFSRTSSIISYYEKEKYEYVWKIKSLPPDEDPDLKDYDQGQMSQSNYHDESTFLAHLKDFNIETCKDSPLHSKWVVGFSKDDDGNWYVFCDLKKIFVKETGSILSCFQFELKRVDGKNQKSFGQLNEFQKTNKGYEYSWIPPKDWNLLLDSTGAMTVVIKLHLLKPITGNNDEYLEKRFQAMSLSNARERLVKILVSGKTGFDTKIICSDGTELNSHRSILKDSSPVLKSMLESGLSEDKTGIIRITDVSGKAMEVLVHYMYTGRLQKSWCDVDIILEVVYATEKYQLVTFFQHLDDILGKVSKNFDGATLFALWKLAEKLSMKIAEAELKENIINLTLNTENNIDILSVFENKISKP